MPYKFAQINISSKAKAKSVGEIYLAEIDVEKELRLGKLFVLVEIDSNRNDALKLINFISAEIPKNYYQNEKFFFKEAGLIKIDSLLEAALTQTNKAFTKFSEEQRIFISKKSVNLTVGVVHKDVLYFSVTGKNKAFLVAKIKDKDGIKTKMINILSESKGSLPETESKKYLFSHIISGPFTKGAYAFFTNETLPEYFSEKKLSQIITTLPPAGAAEQIKNDLENINTYSSMLGLVIKNLKAEKTTVESLLVSPPSDPSASLSYLDKTEKQTETFLSPSGLIPVKKWSNKLVEAIKLKTKKYIPKNDKFILIGEKIILKKRVSRFSPKKMFTGALAAIESIVGFLWYYLSKIKISRQAISNSYKNTLSAGSKAKAWLFGLGRLQKGLLAVFAVCALLFAVNLTVLAQRKKNVELKKTAGALTEEIIQKQNQVEASLLYANEKGAKDIVLEIKALLERFPKESEEQNRQYGELKKKYDEQEEKLSHVVKIDNPKELVNFSLVSPGVRLTSLVKAENKFFAAGPNKEMLKADLAGKVVTTLAVPADYQVLGAPALDKSGDCLYLAGDKIAKLDPKAESFEARPLNYGEVSALGIFSTYNNRLYFINKQANQIVRFKRSGSGYAEPMNWLNEQADLANSVDIDIDGDVYVLNNNGEVTKFASGKKAVFKLDALTRPIEEAKTMQITPAEGGFIYILEPKNKRLVVFKKSGEYVMQYQSDRFDNLTDFFIDEKAKKLYFLNGYSIFEVDMQGIK